jgi:hypothetical protein
MLPLVLESRSSYNGLIAVIGDHLHRLDHHLWSTVCLWDRYWLDIAHRNRGLNLLVHTIADLPSQFFQVRDLGSVGPCLQLLQEKFANDAHRFP